jgi:hypothetical protein
MTPKSNPKDDIPVTDEPLPRKIEKKKRKIKIMRPFFTIYNKKWYVISVCNIT